MLKLRIIGTAAEVEQAVAALRQVLDVDEVSGAYGSRTPDKIRVYVEASPRGPVRVTAERVSDAPTGPGNDPVAQASRRALPPSRPPRRRSH